MRRFPALVAFASSVFLLSGLAVADERWGCLQPALQAELDRKLAYQDGVAELRIEARPEFADIAVTAAAASKASFEMQFAKIAWLWDVDRARFSHPDVFWSLPWSDEDMAAWIEADPQNAAMAAVRDDYRARLSAHPDLAEFRRFLRASQAEPPFYDFAISFGEAVGGDRDAVRACF